MVMMVMKMLKMKMKMKMIMNEDVHWQHFAMMIIHVDLVLKELPVRTFHHDEHLLLHQHVDDSVFVDEIRKKEMNSDVSEMVVDLL